MAEILLACVVGYLLGAVPTGFIVCRTLRGVDIRQIDSGHTGGLNVSRAAGIWTGVLTAVVDTILGIGAVTVAYLLTDNPWASTTAGVAAVVGHNWSIFIRFSGGIGLSTMIGALLRSSPLAALEVLVVLALFWFILTRFFHIHRARTTIFTMLPLGPLLWALGLPLPGIFLGALSGLVVIIKTIPDWNRKYI